MLRRIALVAVIMASIPRCLGVAWAGTTTDGTAARQAERFLRAVYCCEAADLAAVSAADVCISYPIFEEVLGQSAIRGAAAVREFSARFCSRWSAPELTVHETVSEGSEVFLLWSFEAVSRVGTAPEVRRWGGMSYVQLDAEGRVTLELGEESTPGPWARLRADDRE